MVKKKRVMSDRMSYAFVGFLVMGLAFGMLFNQVSVGVLIGFALGLISLAVLSKK
jgi:hypothetical protein